MGKKYTILTLRMALVLFVIILWISGIVIVATALVAEVYLHSYLSPEFSGTAIYVLLGIGVLYVLFSFIIGFCLPGAGPALLSVYGAFLMVICMINVGVGVSLATYKSTFTKTIYDGLMQGIQHYPYDGGLNYISRNMDVIQRKVGCCGVSNYTDWRENSIPISCCRNHEFLCDTNDRTKIHQKGCFERVVRTVEENTGLLITVALAAALYPLVGALLSCCLAHLVYQEPTLDIH